MHLCPCLVCPKKVSRLSEIMWSRGTFQAQKSTLILIGYLTLLNVPACAFSDRFGIPDWENFDDF
jgi:hypothetical protein